MKLISVALMVTYFTVCSTIDCPKDSICGRDCGKNSPVKLDRMEFFTPTISFPSDLQGSVSATLTQETASQLKESYTSLSVDGKKLTNVKFCDTFPSLCLVLDGLKFAGNCNNTNGQSLFKCKDITHQVKFPVAPEIKEGLYQKMKFEVIHPQNGLLECVVLKRLRVIKPKTESDK